MGAVPELAEMDVTSPGAAFARQAAFEAQLLSAMQKHVRMMLQDVAERVRRDGDVYPPMIDQLWRNLANDVALEHPKEMQEWLRDALLEEIDLPSDVYSTVQAVLGEARRQFAGSEETARMVENSLSYEHFYPEQVLAGARWSDDFESGLTAASWWDSLSEAGSVWIKRVRRVTRTTATGVISRFTVTAIRLQDFPRKRWVTRHDARVRHTHRLADGQTVRVDEPFIVGGFSLMYPGDKSAEYGEVVNCRCVLVGVR